jgi:hypothetical protein
VLSLHDFKELLWMAKQGVLMARLGQAADQESE